MQAYTLYQSVRPFGVTAIIGGWDTESEIGVDGQVGRGPSAGAGGKIEGVKKGGPGLYMVEPSGLYWVRLFRCLRVADINTDVGGRDTMVRRLGRVDKQLSLSLRKWTLQQASFP